MSLQCHRRVSGGGAARALSAALALAAAAALAGPGAAAPASGPKPMPMSSARSNAQKPIDITADRLDVDQNAQVATFSGNVRAVQGDITLRSPTLKVYYDRQARKASAASANGQASQSVVQRVEADGGVVIEAPGESARGRRGTYDVVNRIAHLSGDVVLTRGGNVVRGEHAVLDFASGQSRVEGSGSGSGSGSKGRVHGIFVPQKDGKGAGATQSGGR